MDSVFWVLLLTLAPFTLLVLVSQNSLPGSPFYPVKRGMEGAVLAVAAVNPNTRAAFRTELADRRFFEAEKLLLASASTAGFNDLVSEVKYSSKEIVTLKDPVKKKELTTKLISSINDYQTKLNQAKTQVAANQIAPSTSTQSSLTQAPQTQSTPKPNQQNQTQTPPPTTVSQEEDKKKLENSIDNTKDELEFIKKDLENQQTQQNNMENQNKKELNEDKSKKEMRDNNDNEEKRQREINQQNKINHQRKKDEEKKKD